MGRRDMSLATKLPSWFCLEEQKQTNARKKNRPTRKISRDCRLMSREFQPLLFYLSLLSSLLRQRDAQQQRQQRQRQRQQRQAIYGTSALLRTTKCGRTVATDDANRTSRTTLAEMAKSRTACDTPLNSIRKTRMAQVTGTLLRFLGYVDHSTFRK